MSCYNSFFNFIVIIAQFAPPAIANVLVVGDGMVMFLVSQWLAAVCKLVE